MYARTRIATIRPIHDHVDARSTSQFSASRTGGVEFIAFAWCGPQSPDYPSRTGRRQESATAFPAVSPVIDL
jgi:hypothetical protein